MTSYLVCGISLLALAAVVFAGVQSSRLSSARADLATATERLTSVQAERDQAVRDRIRTTVVLTRERDRAVAAERQAADLLERIARDAGTARDGETAPVLRETLQGLHRTSAGADVSDAMPGAQTDPTASQGLRFLGTTRQDALFNGRRPDVWRLVVTRDGRVVEIKATADEKACRDAAMAKAIELVGTPAGEGIKLRCEAARPGESA